MHRVFARRNNEAIQRTIDWTASFLAVTQSGTYF